MFSLTAWGAAGPLRIIHLGVHQIEDGPAVGDRVNFVPGEAIYLSFDVENYAITKEQGVGISWEIEASDPKGVPIVADGGEESRHTPAGRQGLASAGPADDRDSESSARWSLYDPHQGDRPELQGRHGRRYQVFRGRRRMATGAGPGRSRFRLPAPRRGHTASGAGGIPRR
jgi:hypothetical protein